MKNKKLIMGIMVLTVWTLGLTGFGKMVDSAVVEESQIQENSPEKLTVREQVRAPETYRGVPVEVPDVDGITIKRVVPQAFTEEEVQRWLDMVEEIGDEETLKIDESKDDEEELGCISRKIDIGQKPYEFTIYQLKNADGEALKNELPGYYGVSLSLNLRKMKEDNDPSIINVQTNTTSVFEDVKDMGKAQEKSEEILQGFGIEDVSLCGEMVGESCQYNPENQSIDVKWGDIGVFTYERMIDGVPLIWTEEHYYPFYEGKNIADFKNFDDYRWDSERIELRCTDDRLWGLTYANPLKISDYSDEKQFLLPFEAIRQIYEFTITEKFKPIDEVKLSKVRLGYMRIREEEEKREGLLVPVWDFFGTTKDKNGEFYSLLTIDARDGTIRYRKWGY